MSTAKQIGIEEARKTLGDLVDALRHGTTREIVITRYGRPAARLTAYQEDTMQPIDSNIHQQVVTGAEAAALRAAGIDAGAITETPDGVVTVTRPDGSRFVVGDDGTDGRGLQWWTGTRYSADDDIEGTDSWTALTAMAPVVADWWQPGMTIATYTDDGRIYVDGTMIDYYDADGGEWREPVKDALRAAGYEPAGDWQSGEHAYDPATIRVRDIR